MRRASVAVLAALTALPATALDISPVRVSVPAGPAHAELWLTNPAPTAWTGQARLYRWEQAEDREHLLPAQEVAVSPAVLSIAPGQRQRVRVVRLGAAPGDAQQGYRLVISPDGKAGEVRYSLPVFLEPAVPGAAASQLHVRAIGTPAAPRLQLYNDGDGHAHLADLAYVDADGRPQPLIGGLAGYVLPHSMRSWTLPPRADGYVGGRFWARLDDAAAAALPASPAQIAPAASSGL
ncbi:fimbria/pilus periplasmic chaperone [Stenotrophomonas sp.]|uniref:fimbrial biogenesis chaperone n=1 Tax=Stenotrophomonas sp. TaxID=69392 RepID=UPI002FC6CA55